MDTVRELRKLHADYAGRIDWYLEDNPRDATAHGEYQIVVSELDTH